MKIEEVENGSDFKKDLLKLAIAAVDEVLKHRSWETVFTTHTVDEFLFGYTDPLLNKIHEFFPDLVPNPVFGFSVSITSLNWFAQSVVLLALNSIWR